MSQTIIKKYSPLLTSSETWITGTEQRQNKLSYFTISSISSYNAVFYQIAKYLTGAQCFLHADTQEILPSSCSCHSQLPQDLKTSIKSSLHPPTLLKRLPLIFTFSFLLLKFQTKTLHAFPTYPINVTNYLILSSK